MPLYVTVTEGPTAALSEPILATGDPAVVRAAARAISCRLGEGKRHKYDDIDDWVHTAIREVLAENERLRQEKAGALTAAQGLNVLLNEEHVHRAKIDAALAWDLRGETAELTEGEMLDLMVKALKEGDDQVAGLTLDELLEPQVVWTGIGIDEGRGYSPAQAIEMARRLRKLQELCSEPLTDHMLAASHILEILEGRMGGDDAET